MRRAAVAVSFVETVDAPTDGEWEGKYGAISDLVRYHEVPAGSHKMFEGKVHALYCMLPLCSRQPTLFNQWIKAIHTQSDGHTMKCG